jgi:Secretion system C-terminal sorting domain
MKKYQHIFPIFFCLLLATTMNAQFMTPPDQVDDFGLEQFLGNGTINLKNLNPANFINDKNRRFLEQEWTSQGTWRSAYQNQKQFAVGCGLPTRETEEDFDVTSGTFKTRSLDTFIYASNRLKTWNSYRVLNGVPTLSEVAQFTYSTRAAPDTVLSIYITPQFTDTTRFSYTFNASEQLTTIREDEKFSNAFIPLRRAQLTYDTRGNLTRYLIERPDGLNANWLTLSDNRYTYNATNQLTEHLSNYALSIGIDTTKELYSYDVQNRLIKLVSINDGDTTTITMSNHNAKKRPRTLEVQDLTAPFFAKANLIFQANDSLVANMITQSKQRLNDPFANESRFIFEYCGDAVATQEVKKELLNCLVFPNPASESLTIRMKEESHTHVDLSIVNSTGQVVFQARNQPVNSPVSIATLPNGFYVLKVQSAEKIGVTSFTVMK